MSEVLLVYCIKCYCYRLGIPDPGDRIPRSVSLSLVYNSSSATRHPDPPGGHLGIQMAHLSYHAWCCKCLVYLFIYEIYTTRVA